MERGEQMSIQSRQALRLMKFVAEMKKHNFPNAGSFAKMLRKIDVDENISCACSSRTVLRDIEVLEKEYNAPIAYDYVKRGYYLTRPWDLDVPVLGDEILSMTMLGTQIASDILPDPIRETVNRAMEKGLTQNDSSFFDEAMIETILCATGIKAAVDSDVFKKVFDAWRLHQVIKFTYSKPNDEPAEHTFEPHLLAFRNGVWYTKGYEYQTREIRVYAIQRIADVEFGIAVFDTDKKLLAHTRRNGLFEYPKIDGIRLRCASSISFYLYEHQKEKKFKIEPQEDGSLIVTLRPAVEHEVVRWVLGEAGNIEVLYPVELRNKIAEIGRKISEVNS